MFESRKRHHFNSLKSQLFHPSAAYAAPGACTHSLRRTKASIIYKAAGNLRAIQILLGHSKIENTVRYLGVDVNDALSLSEATEI